MRSLFSNKIHEKIITLSGPLIDQMCCNWVLIADVVDMKLYDELTLNRSWLVFVHLSLSCCPWSIWMCCSFCIRSCIWDYASIDKIGCVWMFQKSPSYACATEMSCCWMNINSIRNYSFNVPCNQLYVKNLIDIPSPKMKAVDLLKGCAMTYMSFQKVDLHWLSYDLSDSFLSLAASLYQACLSLIQNHIHLCNSDWLIIWISPALKPPNFFGLVIIFQFTRQIGWFCLAVFFIMSWEPLPYFIRAFITIFGNKNANMKNSGIVVKTELGIVSLPLIDSRRAFQPHNLFWIRSIKGKYADLYSFFVNNGTPRYAIGKEEALHYSIPAKEFTSPVVSAVTRSSDLLRLTLNLDRLWNIVSIILRIFIRLAFVDRISNVSSA